MISLAAIQQRHDGSGVEQYRFQRPKLLRCFLLEPRSGTPDENFPRPATRGRPLAGVDADSKRSPSRTTFEGVQPSWRTSRVSERFASGSSLACIVAAFIFLL